jgi:hypothetical protein
MAIQSNWIVFLFFGFAGLLLMGLIIGLVVYFSRSDKKKVTRDHTTPISELVKETTDAEQERIIAESPDCTHLVSFGRMVKDDLFAVRFDNGWISDPTKLSFVQKNRLEKNIKEAMQWLGTEVDSQKAGTQIPKISSSDAGLPPVVPEKIVEKHKRQMSIVEQVDEILQDLLLSSPLAEKNIRLTEMANKGVIVWVGTEKFEGINAVPDEEVKKIIRQAVKKWEETAGA